MLPIRNISYLLPMCCSLWEKCKNSPKTGLGCSTPLTSIILHFLVCITGWLAHRRASAKLELAQKENEDVRNLSEDVHNLKTELALLESQHRSFSTGELKKLQQQVLQEEQEDFHKVSKDLDYLKDLLITRQRIYCSPFTSRFHRFKLEEQIKNQTYERSYDKDLGLNKGVLDIIDNEKHCGVNGRNGHLMWVYMDLWKARAQMRMYKHVVKRIEDAWHTDCDNFLPSWLPGRASLAIKLLAQMCPNKKTVCVKSHCMSMVCT